MDNISYDGANGISVSEEGRPINGPGGPAEVVQGQYSYTSPEGIYKLILHNLFPQKKKFHPAISPIIGTPVIIQYTAGPDGYVARGSAIPTPPPSN